MSKHVICKCIQIAGRVPRAGATGAGVVTSAGGSAARHAAAPRAAPRATGRAHLAVDAALARPLNYYYRIITTAAVTQ